MEVSFLMLTWNRKVFVEKSFQAFYDKKTKNLDYEFLILDNGSSDGTVELLKELSKNDTRIKVIYNAENKGLKPYKKLFYKAKGKYIITIDDDVLDYPLNFPSSLVNALEVAHDFGYIALDVLQNQYTNGAKPALDKYKEVEYKSFVIQEGPVGGWCTALRRKDFNRFKIKFFFKRMSMKNGDDKILNKLISQLGLKRGVLKDVKCFHACGPYYSKKFGFLNRDMEKYHKVGMSHMVKTYQKQK